jgi:hypothetical protein
MIAALYVATDGAYFGLPDVDPWDEKRDARRYDGPHAVVAHPPCARWCQLAHVVKARYGYEIGDDGGCFAAALASVRRCGGVLEHPAETIAWQHFGLPRPVRRWTRAICRGWVCEVEQGRYGHPARKRTWLYYVGDAAPPELDWCDSEPTATISFMTNHGGGGAASPIEEGGESYSTPFPDGAPVARRKVENMSRAQRIITPPQFRDLLLSMAKGRIHGR